MILITGHPRSGTKYTATLLQAAGKNYGHEVLGEDGTVSWLHISKGGKVSWLPEEIDGFSFGESVDKRAAVEEQSKWEKIIHLVRNPLDVISSAQTLSDEAFEYMFASLKDSPGGERSLRWYMWTWLKWNESIEKVSEYRFKVEDLSIESEVLYKFLKLTGSKVPQQFPSKNVNARPHNNYTWLDLEIADKELCEAVKCKAREYGYTPFTFGAIMIAKNEAHNLHRCLSSIKPLVDEIIFVDTGSTDGTPTIAESYGAKVYHHPWENNFSLHRNQSLDYSTCDWVIQIDCDEELCGEVTKLRYQALSAGMQGYNALAVLFKDMQNGKQAMQFNAPRVFKRSAVHYEDIVHNRPVFDGDAAMDTGEAVVWFQHYGYDIEPKKKHDKLIRTKELLEKRIADNVNDIPAYFYLSQVEGELGNNEKVLQLCEYYIDHKDKVKERFNDSVYYTHLQALFVTNKGQYSDKYIAALNRYMNELPNDLDIIFAAMEYSSTVNNTKLLKQAADRFVSNYLKYGVDSPIQASRFVYTYKPECFCMALFYSSTLSFSTGIKHLDMFNKILPTTNKEFKKKAAKDMQIACKNLGIDWKYSNGQKSREKVKQKKRKK